VIDPLNLSEQSNERVKGSPVARLCDPDLLGRIHSWGYYLRENELETWRDIDAESLDALRAAIHCRAVEERVEYRKTASLADKSSWASNTCSGPDQVRTITTFSDGSSLTSPWTDLPSGEGERG
jgi:hypothetical protein